METIFIFIEEKQAQSEEVTFLGYISGKARFKLQFYTEDSKRSVQAERKAYQSFTVEILFIFLQVGQRTSFYELMS